MESPNDFLYRHPPPVANSGSNHVAQNPFSPYAPAFDLDSQNASKRNAFEQVEVGPDEGVGRPPAFAREDDRATPRISTAMTHSSVYVEDDADKPRLLGLNSANHAVPTPSTISKDDTADDLMNKLYAISKKGGPTQTANTDEPVKMTPPSGLPRDYPRRPSGYNYESTSGSRAGRQYFGSEYMGPGSQQRYPPLQYGISPDDDEDYQFGYGSGHQFEYRHAQRKEIPNGQGTFRDAIPASAVPNHSIYLTTVQPEMVKNTAIQNSLITQDTDILSGLLQRLKDLEAENDLLRLGNGPRESRINIQVFHTLMQSTGKDSRFHPIHTRKSTLVETFLSQPSWEIFNGEVALKGERRIQDPLGYVERKGDVSFIVYKAYDTDHQRSEVDDAIRNNKEIPEPSPNNQDLLLVSEEMIEAVRVFFDQDASFRKEFPFDERQRMSPPFIWWYHYRNTLDASRLHPRQMELVTAFTSWIDTTYGSLYDNIDAQFNRGLVSPLNFQYLIRPGRILISNNGNSPQGYLARSLPIPNLSSTEDQQTKLISSWRIPVCSLGYDGELVWVDGFLDIELDIESGDMETAITSLDFIPLEYSNIDVRQQLESRGEHKFWSSKKSQLVAYEARSAESKSIGQRFMIDFHTYKELHPEAKMVRNAMKLSNNKSRPYISKNGVTGSQDKYLFPREIPGFNFRTKNWTNLDVDLIRKVDWNEKAFGSLVADVDTKVMIQALVTNQLATQKGTDLIENKGNGLILLLHGPPGTGKTYTAESVAEIARKPLYPVTCGDIGTEPEAVEKYLDSVFHLGKIWDCVVLLDEAEIFLEQRTLYDLKRNALVSVFLRTLEYYEGILILTTNRVGTFDEAFKSRISLALRYEKLTKDQRKQVWRNFLGRLEDLGEQDSVDLDDLRLHIDELAFYSMNGRQIRNSISTARQLALYKKTRMTFVHLQGSIILANKFEKYLAEVREGDTSETFEKEKDGRLTDEFFARADNLR
ncbi:hypothetical protein G7054_g2875 [Neopestalotiopsis clavispora]|nr:hypothetical protein G7054_g2875 [Neopestalotiopsis clavispora]